MIREFRYGDQDHLDHNQFSEPRLVLGVLRSDKVQRVTIEDNGVVKAIICWAEETPRVFVAFILMAKEMGLSHVRELKTVMNDAILKYKPLELKTISQNCPKLARWHEFLGFRKTEDDITVNGKKCNMWVMTWASK